VKATVVAGKGEAKALISKAVPTSTKASGAKAASPVKAAVASLKSAATGLAAAAPTTVNVGSLVGFKVSP
jgi:hypothetical protein